MDIVEFVEKVWGVKLPEWQKQLLREFEKRPAVEQKPHIRVMPGRLQGKRATMLIFDDCMGEVKDDSLN